MRGKSNLTEEQLDKLFDKIIPDDETVAEEVQQINKARVWAAIQEGLSTDGIGRVSTPLIPALADEGTHPNLDVVQRDSATSQLRFGTDIVARFYPSEDGEYLLLRFTSEASNGQSVICQHGGVEKAFPISERIAKIAFQDLGTSIEDYRQIEYRLKVGEAVLEGSFEERV